MAEYIEREALIEHIKDLPTWWADSGGVYGQAMKYPEGMFDCDDVINSVDNAPAADVVEVVRKPINEYEGYYEVDQFGRVYSVDTALRKQLYRCNK